MAQIEETYLGDGVYATFDGHYKTVSLDLREQDDSTEIHLEPEVFEKLCQWRKKLTDKTTGD